MKCVAFTSVTPLLSLSVSQSHFVIAGCVDAVFKKLKLESGHSEMLGRNNYFSK